MIGRLAQAIVVAIAVGLGLTLLGLVLAIINVPIATTVGVFLTHYSWGIGALAGIWHFFTGANWLRITSNKQ